MKTPKHRRIWRTTLLVALGIIVIFIDGGTLAIYGNTVVSWYLPLAVGLLLAAATARPCQRMWQWLLGTADRRISAAIHVVAATGVFAFILLGINYFGADDSTLHEERVALLSRHSEKHYRQRRVGRNRYVRGDPYYQYYMTVRLADGREKELSITRNYYHNIARHDSVTLRLENGMLGLPVIRRKGRTTEVPPSSYRRQ